MKEDLKKKTKKKKKSRSDGGGRSIGDEGDS
jgi:hypothetical protein